MKWIKALLYCFISLIALTGCWDQVEIDDYAFVIGLGIDYKDSMLNVTYTFPNLPVITGQGGEGNQCFKREIQAPTLYEANKLFGAMSNKRLNFDHAKVIILGYSVIKEPKVFKQLLDQFERNSDFARTIIVFGTKKKASKILGEETQDKSSVGMYLSELYINNKYDVLKTTETTLGDMITNVNESNGNIILPQVTIEEKEPMIKGVCIITNFLVKGWLDRDEVEKLSWVTGNGKGTIIKVPIDSEDKDEKITVELTKMDTVYRFSEKYNKLIVKMRLYCEGDVSGYTLKPKVSLFKNKNLIELEKKVNKTLQKGTSNMIKIIQEKYGADIFNLLEQLAKNDKALWVKYKQNWDESIKKASFIVEAKTDIRRIGVAK